jgi:hypothetical protein
MSKGYRGDPNPPRPPFLWVVTSCNPYDTLVADRLLQTLLALLRLMGFASSDASELPTQESTRRERRGSSAALHPHPETNGTWK